MKYKELYLEAQRRFAKRLVIFQDGVFDIRSQVNSIYTIMDERRDELSEGLHKKIHSVLDSVNSKCLDLTLYYNGSVEDFEEEQKPKRYLIADAITAYNLGIAEIKHEGKTLLSLNVTHIPENMNIEEYLVYLKGKGIIKEV